MKHFFILFMFVTLIVSRISFSQSELSNFDQESSKWNISFETGFSEINKKISGIFYLSAGYSLSENFEIGIKGDAIYFDRRLNELDKEKTYHIEGGSIGWYIQWYPFGRGNIQFSIPLYLATGTVMYKYDGKYKKDLLWYQEIIDKDDYSLIDLSAQLDIKISKRFSLGFVLGYRTTSEIKMIKTDERILNNYHSGLKLIYNF